MSYHSPRGIDISVVVVEGHVFEEVADCKEEVSAQK
jgi:hypothetical protein